MRKNCLNLNFRSQMKKTINQIIRKLITGMMITSLSTSTFADYCAEVEQELTSVYEKQNQMQLGEGASAPSLDELKKRRDAQMAQVIALRSLKKVRDSYLDFKKEAQNLDVAEMFDVNTKNALIDLEEHTQAVTKYAVIHSTVAALAKKQSASIAENAKEDNPFVKMFNHIKDGDGKNLYSYMKSACNDPEQEVQKECSVFNDFTKNFKLDKDYEEMAEVTINNYGQILKKIYAGSATTDDANEFLETHLEVLKTDVYNVSLNKTKDGHPSLSINKSENSLNLLSENEELKNYYENTILKLYNEVSAHNKDKEIFETSKGSVAAIYLNSAISDESFKNLSSSLNQLKNCRTKLTKCEEFIGIEKLANTINNAHEAIGSERRIANITFDDKDNIKKKFGEILKKGKEETDFINKKTGSNHDFNALSGKYLKELCPNIDNVSDTTEAFYQCIEREVDDSKLSDLISGQEEELANAEKAISDLFKQQPMKDLEIVKAILMKKLELNCRDDVIAETRCAPPLAGGSNVIRTLTKIGNDMEEELVFEDYSRYYYGPSDTNDYKTSQNYLDKYCPETKKIQCNGKELREETDEPDEFPKTCEYLRARKCNQMNDSLVDEAVKLGDNEYYDWDPISERMTKKRHKQSYWPQVAMYAANKSYAFMGPMIATQQLRAQLPGAILSGQYHQQRLAYQEQYYDWYMENLDLTNPYLFGSSYGGVFYSNSASNIYSNGYTW